MSVPARKPYSAPNRQIWSWGIGAIAYHILICTYGQASAIFTIGFGLDAALVSWAIMLPRLIDGITDPILGHLSDNTHTRWGRRKPYLLIGALCGGLAIATLWWADRDWSKTAQFAYLLGIGTFFYVSWGLYAMAFNAIGYELTDDYHERSKVMAIGSLFLYVVLLANAWIYWFALRPLFHNGVLETFSTFVDAGWNWEALKAVFDTAFVVPADVPAGTKVSDEINGIRWIGAAAALIAIATALVVTLGCKERFTHANKKKEHVPMLQALRETVRNKPFFNLLMMKLCQTLGERSGGAILVYLGIYYVCQGDKSLAFKITGIGSTVGTIWGFAMLPLIKPVSRWIGKKGALILGAGGSLVGAVLVPFVYTPEHPYWMLIPSLITLLLMSVSNTIQQAVMPDICDVDELESGQRREGLFTSVMAFVQKIEISLCALLVGYLIVWSGLDTKTTAQAPHVLDNLFWLAVLPNIVFTALFFFLSLRFPLTEQRMIEVRAQLDERHAAAERAAAQS